MAGAAALLVVNAGSSSVKAAVIGADGARCFDASIEEIGGAARLRHDGAARPVDAADHRAALGAILDAMDGAGLTLRDLAGAAHRVVHGGAALTEPARVTPAVRAEIEAAAALAPLHNPANLAGIDALAALAPDLAQVASFDTAFHATNPAVATAHALPDRPETAGLRRYGFHGISYAGVVARLPALSAAPLPRRLLALHLGNGASLCAILDGRSVATTMGYSPLDGLTMGTRSGSIDGNAVLELARRAGLDGAAQILNRESGLKGLGGASDMRSLHQDSAPAAAFAIDHFCYWAVRHAGSIVAAMGGLDALAFTGGIGENDAEVRARIANGLRFLGVALDPRANAAHGPAIHAPGTVPAWIVPADEEATIAAQAFPLLIRAPV